MAVGVEIFRCDAELLARDVEDRPLLRGLGDLNIGLRILVLRGRHESGPSNESCEGMF
jgi:hypothetical protein